ncbi:MULTISPECIES: formylmethanofuran--tetrahydromethanopterin N-formyltransferase [Methanoculleus]|uniref:Formylmethanofuran--tetrahydromethanopterin formyltransferase n=2 Tax=Methanoculleus TaxID=45989 RepID=A3CT61_METMJ|nr:MULTISPECIES: formylmethanofuran--tetrahydromethanopterin N-formyltransferase [Methanoculleus]ABN56561.1 formylmethanofuran-tetrahydromethanopterin formyltransferase [Methanoculleus marisnigri JR1]UYU18000.1 formylmethanofuran--tetrahydromethanopterin N-formyltransferase [Methanoculleus submarinus]
MELNGVTIDDTYAEAFPTWVARPIITAVTEEWAYKAAVEAVGFATSTIGCPAEAGIDCFVSPDETPDGRPGYAIMICASKKKLKEQVVERLAECVLTAPTTAVFDGLSDVVAEVPEKLPVKLHFFGDGYEEKREVGGRTVWAIPIMEGEYIGEEEFGAVKGVAGGNFFIMGENQMAALTAAQAAVDAISGVCGVITPFPGGIVASGSKVGSNKYKFMGASTNEAYCPTLRDKVENSKVPEGVKAIYELVIDGVDEDSIKTAMAEGIRAATRVPGVKFISAGNFGGSLGPFKFELKDVLAEYL